jgi:hypothetical protein
MTHRAIFSRRNLLLAILICVAITGILYGLRRLAPSQSRAIADAKVAIQKGDTRFVTVHGFTVSVPGIPDGTVNGLVQVHGQKPPIGVGDFIRNPIESYQQNTASEYAQFYNVFLFKSLLDDADQKTKSYLHRVRQELQHFAKANAQLDALKAFKSSPIFLAVAGLRENGYPIEDSRTSHIQTKLLLMNALVLRGSERKLFDKVVKNYVLPYNRHLYKLLNRQWEQQGIKGFMEMPTTSKK